MRPSVLGKQLPFPKQLWIPGGVKSGQKFSWKENRWGDLRGHRGPRGLRKGLGSNQVSVR